MIDLEQLKKNIEDFFNEREDEIKTLIALVGIAIISFIEDINDK